MILLLFFGFGLLYLVCLDFLVLLDFVEVNKMNGFDLNSFGFFTQSIPAADFTWDMVCDFALKCYNLFLLYFYFCVAKFAIQTVQRCCRRFSKLGKL